MDTESMGDLQLASKIINELLTSIYNEDGDFCYSYSTIGYPLQSEDLKAEITRYTLTFLLDLKVKDEFAAMITREVLKELTSTPDLSDIFDDNSYSEFNKSLELQKAVFSKMTELLNQWNLDEVVLKKVHQMHYNVPKTQNCYSDFSFKNGRRSMEDRHTIIANLSTLFGLKDSTYSYYGIFDGHAGKDAASYAASHLHWNIMTHPLFEQDIEAAIKEGFKMTDAKLIEKSKSISDAGGTTAVCAFIKNSHVYLAWLGDSEAFVAKEGKVILAVNPHTPSREDERKRIEDMGGDVSFYETWRVGGMLAVSRAIGDPRYKPYVCAEPDVISIPLDGEEDFIVLGCDGLFDTVSPEACIQFIHKFICSPDSYDSASVSENLAKFARNKGSSDNITVIVIFPKQIMNRERSERILLASSNNVFGFKSDDQSNLSSFVVTPPADVIFGQNEAHSGPLNDLLVSPPVDGQLIETSVDELPTPPSGSLESFEFKSADLVDSVSSPSESSSMSPPENLGPTEGTIETNNEVLNSSVTNEPMPAATNPFQDEQVLVQPIGTENGPTGTNPFFDEPLKPVAAEEFSVNQTESINVFQETITTTTEVSAASKAQGTTIIEETVMTTVSEAPLMPEEPSTTVFDPAPESHEEILTAAKEAASPDILGSADYDPAPMIEPTMPEAPLVVPEEPCPIDAKIIEVTSTSVTETPLVVLEESSITAVDQVPSIEAMHETSMPVSEIPPVVTEELSTTAVDQSLNTESIEEAAKTLGETMDDQAPKIMATEETIPSAMEAPFVPEDLINIADDQAPNTTATEAVSATTETPILVPDNPSTTSADAPLLVLEEPSSTTINETVSTTIEAPLVVPDQSSPIVADQTMSHQINEEIAPAGIDVPLVVPEETKSEPMLLSLNSESNNDVQRNGALSPDQANAIASEIVYEAVKNGVNTAVEIQTSPDTAAEHNLEFPSTLSEDQLTPSDVAADNDLSSIPDGLPEADDVLEDDSEGDHDDGWSYIASKEDKKEEASAQVPPEPVAPPTAEPPKEKPKTAVKAKATSGPAKKGTLPKKPTAKTDTVAKTQTAARTVAKATTRTTTTTVAKKPPTDTKTKTTVPKTATTTMKRPEPTKPREVKPAPRPTAARPTPRPTKPTTNSITSKPSTISTTSRTTTSTGPPKPTKRPVAPTTTRTSTLKPKESPKPPATSTLKRTTTVSNTRTTTTLRTTIPKSPAGTKVMQATTRTTAARTTKPPLKTNPKEIKDTVNKTLSTTTRTTVPKPAARTSTTTRPTKPATLAKNETTKTTTKTTTTLKSRTSLAPKREVTKKTTTKKVESSAAKEKISQKKLTNGEEKGSQEAAVKESQENKVADSEKKILSNGDAHEVAQLIEDVGLSNPVES